MKLLHTERCVCCHEEIYTDNSWVELFSKIMPVRFCDYCKKQLAEISGETCRICGRSFENGQYIFKRDDVCFDCIRWESDPNWNNLLESNTSIFVYNDFLKETIATFKFRGDYIIAHAFANYFKAKLKVCQYDLLVPIPLSKERQFERGFNQAEALIVTAGLTATYILSRIHTEKQSKKSRSQRIHHAQVFEMSKDANDIKGKKIVLIDDIYTTGSTLRYAAIILKDAGASSIRSLTLARG